MTPQRTSWQSVSNWYNSSVGESGHYYHQHVVLPNTLRLLQLQPTSSLLDLACGQGVLARQIPPQVYYQGVDVAKSLIQFAQTNSKQPTHHFAVADITRATLPVQKTDFSHATVILALQNIEDPQKVFANAARHLQPGGKLVIVLNHPCFRIPRQSSWGVDDLKKTQFRRIDRYFSPLKIPIEAHPSHKKTSITWSFHLPLSAYFQYLSSAGFLVENLEEWNSDKTSVGKAAKMENRSRGEFPLFLALLAVKK
jgi:ubiquinone/menaquinone biosynthesis C-methylase UbiE